MRTRTDSNRRRFLKHSAALAASAAAAPFAGVPNILKAQAPNNKLGVAVIGCGAMGRYSTQQALKENFVAIADVDDNTVAQTMRDTIRDAARPKLFADYRKMLDECQKEIDVVLIAAPDHQHAPSAIRAIQLNKHVFVQKPLAHNIRECRVLAEAAAKSKVHSQMGNQGHVTGEGYRLLCEHLWSGGVGNIVETHTVLGRNFGGAGARPASAPIPAGVHWDEWLGPAPYRDYHAGLHPFNWRNWRDFGTGTLGDMACHLMDGVFTALRLGEAKSYSVECVSQTAGSEEKFSTNNVLRWDIPARGNLAPSTTCGGTARATSRTRTSSCTRPATARPSPSFPKTSGAGFLCRNRRSKGLACRARSRTCSGPSGAAPRRSPTSATPVRSPSSSSQASSPCLPDRETRSSGTSPP
jgi:predicted dehydrogenase